MRSVHSEQPQFVSDMGHEVLFPRVKLARAHNTDLKSLLWLHTQWKEEGNAWEAGKSGDTWLSTKPFGTKINKAKFLQEIPTIRKINTTALSGSAVFSLALGDTQMSCVIRPYLLETFPCQVLADQAEAMRSKLWGAVLAHRSCLSHHSSKVFLNMGPAVIQNGYVHGNWSLQKFNI